MMAFFLAFGIFFPSDAVGEIAAAGNIPEIAYGIPPHGSRDDHLCNFADTPSIPSSRIPRWVAPPVEELANYTATMSLGRWARDGVQLDQVRAAAMANPLCMSLRIINGHVLAKGGAGAVQRAKQPFMNSRYNNFLELVEMAIASKHIPDLELAWCPGDCALGNPEHMNNHGREAAASCPGVNRPGFGTGHVSDLPTFTPVGCLGSDAIAAPMQYDRPGVIPFSMSWQSWSETQQHMLQAATAAAPAVKEQIIFRGRTNTHCWDGVNGSSWASSQNCGRSTLFKHGLDHPDAIDFTHSRVDMINSTGDGAFNEYRYSIVVEGNCGWADRTKVQLHMAPALFIQQSFCKEIYSFALQPWVHFIPVDYFLHSVYNAWVWAQGHRDDVAQVVENAHNFARSALSVDANVATIRRLLELYSAAQRFTIPSTEVAHEEGFLPATEFKFRGITAQDARASGLCTAPKWHREVAWTSTDRRIFEWAQRRHGDVDQWNFFHIPKCAGSSLIFALEDSATKAGLEVCNGKSNARSLCRNSNASLVHGHQFFGLGNDARKRGLIFRSFTFLRHPVPRVQSLYNYIRESKPHPKHAETLNMSIIEFVQSNQEASNEMTRMLCGLACSSTTNAKDALALSKQHLLEEFAFVGLQECFHESNTILSSLLPWVPHGLAQIFTNAGRERSDLTYAEKQTIIHHNTWDLELYQFGVEMFRASYLAHTTSRSA